MMKLRRMRLARHAARMGALRGMQIGYWWESQKERGHYEDLRCRWVVNLKMDVREMGWVWYGLY
jgi:hypothetical protein